MTSNLTRDEAIERARLLNAVAYRVELDLTGCDEVFRSATVVSFCCTRPGAPAFADLTASTVQEIVLNGEPVPLTAFDGDRIHLTALREVNELRVVAGCAYSRSGEGLHRFTDPADGGVYLYSQMAPFDTHRVYACFDQPDLKASFELTVTAPADWQVISNMAPDVAGAELPGQARRWHFPPTPVMPTYITAVAAGPYHMVRSGYDGIPLGIYCRASLAQHLGEEEIFQVTRQGFGFYHAMFGIRYPFGKYDQVFVPEFNAGAMENAGCVVFKDDLIFRSRVTDSARARRAGIILHEMAHMWFGDLVTMHWWDDLWLNESFATWAGTLAQAEATRWTTSWTTFTQLSKARAYRQDQLPSTHPIAADISDIEAVMVNFDDITYAKGASVLKQLVAYVGRDNFLAGLRRYFERHAWSNTGLGDLLAPVAEVSGRDLSGWSSQWLESAGVNILRPVFTTGADGTFTSFAIRQEAPASHPVLRDHRIAIGLYDRNGGALVRRHRVEADISGELTEIGELLRQRQPDLVLVNDDDLSYAKIRLDPRSLDTVMTSIGDFAEPLPAALCWAAAWDMCRDADLAARDYLRLVLGAVSSVADISVAQNLLQQAAFALRRYTDPAWRQHGLELTARSLRGLMERAEPGSDAQLALTQAFTDVATGPDDLTLLTGLLDGSAHLPGLTVDTELRWCLLHRLVRRGAAGEAEIAAELAADPTDAGRRHAASARAAIPTPEAKRAAWQQITAGTLANAMFGAMLDGFTDLDQLDLLKRYHRPFFEVVGDIWQSWGSDMAQRFVISGFPVADSPSLIEAADELIASDGPPAALRRLLLEGRDGLARALRCQERDRQAG